ncbi:AAA family ATPase [Lentzea californiensis]|uniref:AAA family ATPase n=1 Tax=Lentzea californiensis TaxID=438851 RepID=UPI00216573BF|nr:MoxR family ATPase [Lentzea californiensis]MCR3754171.1 AAA domain (dynein-related subfamily) [Lentzea californiensis]
MSTWHVYRGDGSVADTPISELPAPPPWRTFAGEGSTTRPSDDGGEGRRRVGAAPSRPRVPDPAEVSLVNAAIHLRRPLLLTGQPGTGKSSLAYLIARELGLGPVLRWPITSRMTMTQGLFLYDAIARVQSAAHDGDSDIGDFIHLGPLGTALLPADLPRVLLIDELDKGDIDLPNDLLNVFEEGEYEIPELVRYAKRQSEVTVLTEDKGHQATVRNGIVRCREFPIVIITSNGEREFPPAFLRRCLRLRIENPNPQQLGVMVTAHFGGKDLIDTSRLISEFLDRSGQVGGLAADQLLNAVHLATHLATSGAYTPDEEWKDLLTAIWHPLTEPR